MKSVTVLDQTVLANIGGLVTIDSYKLASCHNLLYSGSLQLLQNLETNALCLYKGT
jgi:hypothetical protein